MKLLMSMIKKRLCSKRGETLVEAIISILLLTILMTTVTAMIQTSLRMTVRSMDDARHLQESVFNQAVYGEFTESSQGILLLSINDLGIDIQHDIIINDDIEPLISFFPTTD